MRTWLNRLSERATNRKSARRQIFGRPPDFFCRVMDHWWNIFGGFIGVQNMAGRERGSELTTTATSAGKSIFTPANHMHCQWRRSQSRVKQCSEDTHQYVAQRHQMNDNAQLITRDSIYAIARICYGNSVCLSVTRVDQPKTVKARITQFSPYSSPIPLVFRG